MDLSGKTAIISGGSQGFGFEVAKQFVSHGANVVIGARQADVLASAKNTLSKIAKNSVRIATFQLDVKEIEEVNELIKFTLKELGDFHILVANAGVYGTKGLSEDIDPEEWSDAIDINLKGTFWQCRAVLPHFKQKKYGKIIILSGGGATKPMPYFSAYAASKAGVVRLGETLAFETKADGIDVNMIAPGALNTRLLDEVLAAGSNKVGDAFYQEAMKQKQSGGHSLEKAAKLCVFLASPQSDGITGRLISAVWDPWEKLSEWKDELAASDIYTLRRITAKERGKNWEEN